MTEFRKLDLSRGGTPVIIYNPVKVKRLYRIRKAVNRAASEIGMEEPLWIETTPDDPGTGQAAEAVRMGASLVIAAGGDGTVRAVAAGLAHTGIPLAIIPCGTGNLLARNLAIPMDNIDDAVDIAFFGAQQRIDMSWLDVRDWEGEAALVPEASLLPEDHIERLQREGHPIPRDSEYPFLVISGQGWDAELMAGTDSELKQRVGWGAYVVAGVQALRAPRTRFEVTLDRHHHYRVKARSLLFANCSTLMVGVVLVPDAKLDDGQLDVTVLDAAGGMVGWATLFSKIALQGIGLRRDELLGGLGNLGFRQARTVSTRIDEAQPIQVDGDAIGYGRAIDVRVERHALVVRRG